MILRTKDEETTQHFMKASARVRQKRRTLSVRRTGVFEEQYEPIGVGSETDIKDTRAQDEHIKNLPVGQMEILMADNRQGTLHSHLHVRVPYQYRFPGLEPGSIPLSIPLVLKLKERTCASEILKRSGAVGVYGCATDGCHDSASRQPNGDYLSAVGDHGSFLLAVMQARPSYDPASQRPAEKPADSFVDFVLKRINPSDKNYGQCIDEGRKLVLEETIENGYFWSNMVALGLLACLFVIIAYQHKRQARREWVMAEVLQQYEHALARANAQVDEATKRNHELMEALTGTERKRATFTDSVAGARRERGQQKQSQA